MEGVRKVPCTKIANQKTGEVIYTPPSGYDIIIKKLSDLEKFIYSDNNLDSLIKLALVNYQFEAIHPFGDGNGRTGRIINILFLLEKKILDRPILFLSDYILKNKSDYYKALKDITESNKWESWILFMLEALHYSAVDTLDRIDELSRVQEEVASVVKEKLPKIYSHELVEVIFSNPYTKINYLEEVGIAKRQTASKYLDELVKLEVLSVVESGRDKYFINVRMAEILSR